VSSTSYVKEPADITSTDPLGTIVHPSVFLLLDHYSQGLQLTNSSVMLSSDIQSKMGVENINFWKKDPNDISDRPASVVRILVCGNAGVGKSSLINCVFGDVQVS
jgi:ribosome biogenesis GTPase A